MTMDEEELRETLDRLYRRVLHLEQSQVALARAIDDLSRRMESLLRELARFTIHTREDEDFSVQDLKEAIDSIEFDLFDSETGLIPRLEQLEHLTHRNDG